MLYILDYGAGNVRSLANSITKLGHTFEWVRTPEDILKADKLLFPGVGAFGPALESLRKQGYAEPLRQYIASGKPYMGICVGMQALFEASTESPGTPGLGIVPGTVEQFSSEDSLLESGKKAVPQMGWNTARVVKVEQAQDGSSSSSSSGGPSASAAQAYGFPTEAEGGEEAAHYYFVHSFRAAYNERIHAQWAHTVTQYGSEVFLSSVQHGNVFATQFHPEKSGAAGLKVLKAWLDLKQEGPSAQTGLVEQAVVPPPEVAARAKDGLTKRIVACLDVRTNDDGDLVVTKGESYDVREKAEGTTAVTATPAAGSSTTSTSTRAVRNLGKPVDLARRYYLEGADEITFLNITSFRSCPLQDQPMLAVLEHAAADIFVPLTIGGGIKDTVDPDGTPRPALEVAAAYFRAGADKVSIGSEAVFAVEELLAKLPSGVYDPARATDADLSGKTGIETISKAYGAQAVVVSIDPRRVYLQPGEEIPPAHAPSVVTGVAGTPEDGKRWWYRCTVKGGREDRDVDVVQLARGVQRLGAGEVLLNSIDRDGSNAGFDRQLVDLIKSSVQIPVIASSGAGNPTHFSDVFSPDPHATGAQAPIVEAALAAGIFHRKECTIAEVKDHLRQQGFKIRSETVES
ncbi:Histidine biosynthesis bifunctional protein hisB [Tilletia horrida]|uniref:Histidine biosynthesis bifunctional protein hisB n=1 Tax=Tilletia horrida TaxID=155126 RepID=A0AAN6GTT9_9BASI|nr:Histidine biosynthesis bifunctional protein hisB [Tilletia horrida]KAK0556463.1 Histidine biosynthesis bifunctional protein hisB [Tilletia horrida]KAK0569393.1 Histidine biosynthesis bifunctional protein hisB [Tilletia horrida]